ncbi:MAG TPA: NAD(P)-dependent oxidoreductase [Archangium sp.]
MSLAIVTGATGWLGRALCEALLDGLKEVPSLATPPAGRKVRALVHGPTTGLDPRVEAIAGDLATGQGVDALFEGAKGATVFHVAGVIHPSRGVKEFHEVNTEGTKRLLDAAKKAGVRRFIYVSSNSPIGTNGSPSEVFDESAPYHPYMGYGRSKRAAEEAVLAAGKDLEIVIIRPPWFYGPRQPARQNTFFTMIRTGKGPLVGGGKNRRSMAYVDNICQGLLLCEKVEAAKGNVYWIADERPYEMTEIIDTVERLLEKEFNLPCTHGRLRLPGLASEMAYLVDATLQGVGLYHQKIHVLSEMNKTIACSVDKAKRELGYAPTVSLEEGMRRSIRWVLDNGGVI